MTKVIKGIRPEEIIPDTEMWLDGNINPGGLEETKNWYVKLKIYIDGGLSCYLSAFCLHICLHLSYSIMSAMASQITSIPTVQPFVQAQINENAKAPRYWPFWGEFTGDRRIPYTKSQQRGECLHLMTASCMMNFWHRLMQPGQQIWYSCTAKTLFREL